MKKNMITPRKKFTLAGRAAILSGLLLCGFGKAELYAADEFQWVKQGKFSYNSYGCSLASDAAGNTYSIGNFSGTVDFDPGPGVFNMTSNGKTDAFILKLNADGDFVWAKQIGGTDEDNAVGVHADAAGNVYVCGTFSSNTIDIDPGTAISTLNRSGKQDVYVLKLNASGSYAWGKQIGGGTSECSVYSIATDGSGNVVFCGYFTATADFDPGSAVFNMTCKSTYYEGFLCKLSASGSFVWSKQLEGDQFNGASHIAADAAGNVYALGIFQDFMDCDPGPAVKKITTKGMVDLFIIKLDASGNFAWSAHAGGTEPDWSRGIAVDASGNVFAVGTFDGVADFNPDGAGYMLTSVGSSWNPDGFILKLDATGKFSWVKQLGSMYPDEIGGMTLDAAGNIYTIGSFTGVMDCDPGPSATYLKPGGNFDMFISKLDAAGNFVWGKSTSGYDIATSQAKGYSIAVDASQNVYSMGSFMASVDFDPGPGKADRNASDGGSFVHKIGSKLSEISETSAGKKLNIQPNPSHGVFNVRFGQEPGAGTLSIRNILGQAVGTYAHFSGNDLTLNLSNEAAGIYLVEWRSAGENIMVKIIKE